MTGGVGSKKYYFTKATTYTIFIIHYTGGSYKILFSNVYDSWSILSKI